MIEKGKEGEGRPSDVLEKRLFTAERIHDWIVHQSPDEDRDRDECMKIESEKTAFFGRHVVEESLRLHVRLYLKGARLSH